MAQRTKITKGMKFRSNIFGNIAVATGKSAYSKELKTTYYEVIIPDRPDGENKFFVDLALYTPVK